jgi:hypothetical protein
MKMTMTTKTNDEIRAALVNAAEELLTFLEERGHHPAFACAAMGMVITALLPDAADFTSFVATLYQNKLEASAAGQRA